MVSKPNIVVLFALCLGLAACGTPFDPSKDVELTWDQAYVHIPGLLPTIKEFREDYIARERPNTKFPTVIYMHGGGRIGTSAHGDMEVAREAGLAVIALNSFARERPENPGANLMSRCRSCWDIFRAIFALRTAELAYALEQVQHLSWVDQNNLFIWGHSEGGYTVAAYKGSISKARLITGTGCAYGFRAEEPALAVISRRDPYVAKHRLEHTYPSTCLRVSGNASNLTYVELPGNIHNAAQTPEGRKAFIEFLQRHITPPN
jgi:dienelactone hydrolase